MSVSQSRCISSFEPVQIFGAAIFPVLLRKMEGKPLKRKNMLIFFYMHNLDMRSTKRTFNDMMWGQKVSQPHVSGKPGN